jgi:hemerythrin-like metal-binding protein
LSAGKKHGAMTYVTWEDWMSTGVPLIDADHKLLLSLINQVYACVGANEEYATLGSVLQTLADYTDYHFQREEALLAEVGFPALAAHQELHVKLAAQVSEILRRFHADRGAVRGQDMLAFLKTWLTDHILEHDMAYKRFTAGQGQAEETAAAIGMGHMRGAQPPLPFDWSQIRVLVVDDNVHFRTLMETILSGIGIGYVKVAADAAEGLELLSRQAVDAVVSDWYMAGMDGLEFCHRIRSSNDPIVSNVGLLMVSGRGDDEVRSRAAENGVDAFLEKPISARNLLLTIAQVITARRG